MRELRTAHVRRRRRRGQALTEFALSAPILILLLLGAGQVGAILYAQIQVDTAAREGAREAAFYPNGSQAFSNGATASTTTCTGTSSTNPVCQAVVNSAGALSGSGLTTVITPLSAPTPAANNTCSAYGYTDTSDGYVSVAVSYNVPMFVPLLNLVLETPGHTYRTVTSTEILRLDPCTVTDGN